MNGLMKAGSWKPGIQMGTHQRAARRGGNGNATDVRHDEFTKLADASNATNNVTRDEFVQATTEIRKHLDIQFQRIAQMQADVDSLKAALRK